MIHILKVLDLDVSHTDVDYELVIEDDDISEDGNDHEVVLTYLSVPLLLSLFSFKSQYIIKYIIVCVSS